MLCIGYAQIHLGRPGGGRHNGSRAWSTPTPASASERCCASPSLGRPFPLKGEGFNVVIAQIARTQQTLLIFIICDCPAARGARERAAVAEEARMNSSQNKSGGI